jgi:hypothetical protein
MSCITQCLICHAEIWLSYDVPLEARVYVCTPCAKAYYASKGNRLWRSGMDYDLWPESFRDDLLKVCPQCRKVHQ